MRRIVTTIMLMFGVCSSQAEVISLVCEHDGGIHIKTGLPNSVDWDIFTIEFDAESNKLVTPFFEGANPQVGINDTNIVWFLEVPSLGQYWNYNLNRHTGTLFLKRTIGTDIYMATGQCVVPNRLF